MNFRSEVFNLCKVIENKMEVKEIKKLIYCLSVHVEKTNSKGNVAEYCQNRSDFGYISRHSNNQFYGFLYTDEHIESYKELFPDIKPLNKNEKKIIEKSHATVMALVDGCLYDLKGKYPILYDAINPYSKYKIIKATSEESILCEEELKNAIYVFKNSKLYQKLFSSQIVEVFKNIPLEQMKILLDAMDRDIIQTPLDIVSDDIRNFSIRILNRIKDMPDAIMAGTLLIMALRESLSTACQLLFLALAGEKLIVLNDNNIINIENAQSNSIYEVMTVLVDGILIRWSTELPGDVVLIDCNPSDNHHIHEFGIIRSATISFNSETGQTTKLSFVTIDENMNILHNLTDAIIKAEIPPIIKSEPLQ